MRKALLGLVVCVLALLLIAGGTLLYLGSRLDHQLHRVPAFDGLHDRPSRAAGRAAKAVNILLLGTDRRSDVGTTGTAATSPDWVPGEQRSDTLMIVHVAADRRTVDVVSIPRDSWVEVPGHGAAKINAAFSYGGARLAVATVEQLTNVRIDHVAIVDWDGFKALTDVLGGVDVDIPRTVYDSARHITWPAGRQHLDGDDALNYVGQRHGLPGGDLDRVRRQQAFLRSLFDASLHEGTLTNPRKLYQLLTELTRHATVDEAWSMGAMSRLGLSLQGLRSSGVRFATAPVQGFGTEGAQSVVYLDKQADAALWRGVRDDTAGTWLANHPQSVTPARVN